MSKLRLSDDDSAYGGGNSAYSDTTSVTSSVYQGIIEHGRRYQALKEAGYFTPADDAQFELLNTHHIVHLTIDSQEYNVFFRSPVSADAKRILDLGCGTGAWCIDVADQYPEVTVHGVDLYPPSETWLPPNCIFEVDDVSKSWTFTHKFHLINIRFMLGAFRSDEWDRVYRQAYRYLNPGGWIEHIECGRGFVCDDESVPKDAPILKWGLFMKEAGEKQW